MEYWEDRAEKVKILHNIYSSGKDTPEYIKWFVDIPEMQRLNGVDQNSGINMTGFKLFNYKYSVLDHAVGTALILNNFITKKNQIIAGLLHELATPAFVDSTYCVAESNFNPKEREISVYDAIVGSDKLFEYLTKTQTAIEDVCDYTRYPIVHNSTPNLSAHALERTLHTLFLNGVCNENEIKEFYDSLIVVPNENKMPELCFNNEFLANKFCLLSLECGEKFRSYEAKASIKFISDTIAAMVRREVISRKDLYTYSDRVIMDMGMSCSDKRISDRWNYLSDLNKVYTKFNKVEERKCFKIWMESKYLDPLIRYDTGEYNRASARFDLCRKKMNSFLNSDTDLYFYIEYED